MKELIKKIKDLVNNISEAVTGDGNMQGELIPAYVPVTVGETEEERKIREREEAEEREKYYWL